MHQKVGREHLLRAFQNKVVCRIFVLTAYEVTKKKRKLCNEINNL
jgi:hypothetical protein